jgi:hypothetical protein
MTGARNPEWVIDSQNEDHRGDSGSSTFLGGNGQDGLDEFMVFSSVHIRPAGYCGQVRVGDW